MVCTFMVYRCDFGYGFRVFRLTPDPSPRGEGDRAVVH